MSSIDSPALRTLQISPKGHHVVGKNRKITKSFKDSGAKLTDYNFSKTTLVASTDDKKVVKNVAVGTVKVSTENSCIGTDIDATVFKSVENSRDNIVRMMISNEPTSSYWKTLATERKSALEDVMRENLQCFQELARLNEENRRLKRLADEYKELKRILQLDEDEKPAVGSETESN